jgi:beta-lactamase class A
MAPNPARLKATLDSICERFRGVMGYSLYHTRHQHRLNRLGDEIFPTASTIKTAVMAKAFEEIEAGRLRYDETLPITPDDVRDGAGVLQFFREKQSVSVKLLLHLMITLSDNTATTPNEMVELLDAIRTGRAGSPAACDRMLRILSHQFYDDLIGTSAPPWVVTATKSGAIERSRSDTGIVFSPSGAYILAVYTKEAEDTRWTPENEGEVAIREVARAVWRFYHPRDKWQPPTGMERYPPA